MRQTGCDNSQRHGGKVTLTLWEHHESLYPSEGKRLDPGREQRLCGGCLGDRHDTKTEATPLLNGQLVTSLLPLATDVAHPAGFMAVSGKPADYRSALQREVLALITPQLLPEQRVESIELRFL